MGEDWWVYAIFMALAMGVMWVGLLPLLSRRLWWCLGIGLGFVFLVGAGTASIGHLQILGTVGLFTLALILWTIGNAFCGE